MSCSSNSGVPPDLNQSCESHVCPICLSQRRDEYALWQHIYLEHISSHSFPPLQFLKKFDRRLCSTCGFSYARRWRFCRRSQGPGRSRCGGAMIDPGNCRWLNDISDVPCTSASISAESNDSLVEEDGCFSDVPVFDDPVMEAINSATRLSCPSHLETFLFDALMEEISHLHVKSVGHIPRSVRPLLGNILSVELRHATKNGLWGFARLQMFAKAVLRCPPRGGKKKRYVIKALLKDRLERWQSGDLVSLWSEARSEAYHITSHFMESSIHQVNAKRSLTLAREGRFRDAMRSLGSHGTAAFDDIDVTLELQQRHPCHDLPEWNCDIPPPLTVTSDSVLAALLSFPRGSSPGASQLLHQHLLDAIDGTTTPSSMDCLESLTQLVCYLLSGRADVRFAPWLTGALLTALRKKQGGVRRSAVGEVLRRLVSRLCCAAVKASLPEVFVPYGQVGVGVTGGVEAAIHALSTVLAQHGENVDLCCLKIDFTNAFNECHHSSFLHRLHREFPALFAWSQWCYHCESRLHFGDVSIPSSGGVQKGDPLGPLLFSLVIIELMDDIDPLPDINLKMWYLDDGSFVGSRRSVASLLNILQSKGPSFGLHLNLSKCEIFWPSGNQQFPEFAPEVQRINNVTGGAELLGSPIHGSEAFFANSVAKRIDRVLSCQDHLSDLGDPQVELHLLRNCLELCKVNHLLRTVPTEKISEELIRFDSGLRHCLQTLSRSSVSDHAWLQSTLPKRLGGLGLREALGSSPAAFIGSCNLTRDLTSKLLSDSNLLLSTGRDDSTCFEDIRLPDLIIPGELDCQKHISTLLTEKDVHPFAVTQKQIQRILDENTRRIVQEGCSSIRDRARLNAISTPHSGSWLRAIPNSHLKGKSDKNQLNLSL